MEPPHNGIQPRAGPDQRQLDAVPESQANNTPSSDGLLVRIVSALERIAHALEQEAQSCVAAVQPEALSKEDAAKFTGLDVGAIEYLIRVKKLSYVQHGSQRGRVIPVESLREFLKKHGQEAVKEVPEKRRKSG